MDCDTYINGKKFGYQMKIQKNKKSDIEPFNFLGNQTGKDSKKNNCRRSIVLWLK